MKSTTCLAFVILLAILGFSNKRCIAQTRVGNPPNNTEKNADLPVQNYAIIDVCTGLSISGSLYSGSQNYSGSDVQAIKFMDDGSLTFAYQDADRKIWIYTWKDGKTTTRSIQPPISGSSLPTTTQNAYFETGNDVEFFLGANKFYGAHYEWFRQEHPADPVHDFPYQNPTYTGFHSKLITSDNGNLADFPVDYSVILKPGHQEADEEPDNVGVEFIDVAVNGDAALPTYLGYGIRKTNGQVIQLGGYNTPFTPTKINGDNFAIGLTAPCWAESAIWNGTAVLGLGEDVAVALNEQNQVIVQCNGGGSVFGSAPQDSYLVEGQGDPIVLRDQMPDTAKAQYALNPQLISDQKKPGDDETICILAEGVKHNSANGGIVQSVSVLCTRDKNGKWDFRRIQLPPPYSGKVAAKAVNANGFMAGTDFATGHVLLYVPMDLMVDANRDGYIKYSGNASDENLADREDDITSKDKPYRFWINDDDDDASGVGKEVIASGRKDYSAETLKSQRGLEDFARLWVSLPDICTALKNGDVQLGLRWKDDTSFPAIKLFYASDGGSTEYITDPYWANIQLIYGPSNGTMTLGGSSPAIKFTNNETSITNKKTSNGEPVIFVFPKSVWSNIGIIDGNGTETHFLFEGVGDGSVDAGGSGRLEMVFLDKNGVEIGSGGSLCLTIRNIKNMYVRNVSAPDDITLPYDSNGHNFPYTGQVHSELGKQRSYTFQKASDEAPQCVVFVHGWDMTPSQYYSYSETFFKRLWWQGYKGRFAAFYWLTLTGKIRTYNASEYRAWMYGPALKEYIDKFTQEFGSNGKISVAAHSMGNIITGSALNNGMHLYKYLALQAAIPSACYDSSNSIDNLQQFTDKENEVPTPDSSSVWGYSGYLAAAKSNPQKIVSFYNTHDFALSSGNSFGPFSYVWVENELLFKPDGFSFPTFGYRFHHASAQAQPDYTKRSYMNIKNYDLIPPFDFVETFNHFVTGSLESMAFVARPRSNALGADNHASTISMLGGEGNVFDLNHEGGLTDDRLDHDGEFERNLQYSSGGGSIQAIYQRVYAEVK